MAGIYVREFLGQTRAIGTAAPALYRRLVVDGHSAEIEGLKAEPKHAAPRCCFLGLSFAAVHTLACTPAVERPSGERGGGEEEERWAQGLFEIVDCGRKFDTLKKVHRYVSDGLRDGEGEKLLVSVLFQSLLLSSSVLPQSLSAE